MKLQTILILLLLPFLLIANTEISWKIELEENINWQKVTSYGYFIVQAGNSIYGINTENGAIAWQNKLSSAAADESYREIPNTPFFTLNTEDNQIVGINPADGKMIFSTIDLGIEKIQKVYPLPLNNSLMLLAQEDGKDGLSMLVIDLVSGKKKWSNDEDFGKLTGYAELNKDEFMMSSFAFVYRVNTNSGEIIFKKSAMDNGGANSMQLGMLMEALGSIMLKDEDLKIQFHLNPLNTKMVVLEAEVRSITKDENGNEKENYSVSYTAFSTEDGSSLWKEPYKLDGNLGSVYFLKDGVIVSPLSSGKSKTNKLDINTGEGLWGKKGKGLSTKGSILSYQELPEGILTISSYDKEHSADSDLYLNILGYDLGEEKFSKPVKIKGGLEFTEMTPRGLLYKTNLELDFINLADGSTILDNPLRSAIPFNASKLAINFSMPIAMQGNFIYTYSDKEKSLYRVNKDNGEVKLILENIKLEGKEIPTSIELFDDGIVLTSDQNILKCNYDGVLLFQNYFQAPSANVFKKALLLAQAARAVYIGAAYKMSAAVYSAGSQQADNPIESAIYDGLGQAFDEGGNVAMSYAKDAFTQVKERVKATQQSRNFVFMMMEETKREYTLIQVDKHSGEIKQKIVVGKDKDPNYAVDDITNKVYYASDDRVISCYSFK